MWEIELPIKIDLDRGGGPLGLPYKALGMKCLLYFGITSMKEDTSAQLSGRGELHEGLRL